MMKKLLIISLFIAPTVAMAQTADKTVTGTVTDAATGQPLAGVYVQAYGNGRFSAMTDENGQYQIKVPDYTTSLSMRIDGYQLLQRPSPARPPMPVCTLPLSAPSTSRPPRPR